MDKVSNDTDLTLLCGIEDRELWYAEGGEYDDEGLPEWRFPIFVDWKSVEDGVQHIRYASLFTAVCPSAVLALKLKALFEVHTKIHRTNQWLVRAEVVPALLKKAPGITPWRYHRWGGKEQFAISYTKATMPDQPEPRRFKCQHGDTILVSRIAEECGLQTSVVKIVLDGLSNAASGILIDQHKPLDLGFVKLIAVPFRANWKEIVCFKLRKLGLLRILKEGVSDLQGNDSVGLPETFCSPHNIALRREKTKKGPRAISRMDYSIEAITSKQFEQEVAQLECRQHSLGHTAYVGYYEKTVERLYKNILEILRAYRQKIGYPFARVCDGRWSGGLRFIEQLGIRARAHGRNLRDLPVHIVPPARGFSAIAEESEPLLVHSPPVEVPKVPAFSQAPDDLRKGGKQRALEEFSDGIRGTGGLPVPDAGQGPPAGEPVLSESEAGRRSSWVEIIGD